MSLTLGEKLRQAREAKGISISEVAEQTRISRLYLESIENNDYRTLPGGIFNKGFVKSYARYVGVDDQEALRDYAQLISDQGETAVEETKNYRPEVLTDDRSNSSMLPTLIFAIIILALLSWGVITLVNYLRGLESTSTTASTGANANKPAGNTSSNSNNANGSTNDASAAMPASNEIKVQLKALAEKISVEATVDGNKSTSDVLVETPTTYTGTQSVKLRYYKGFTADKVQLMVNGKVITAPSAPANPKMQGIEFEINKENIQQIWQSGAIVAGTATPTGTVGPANTPVATPTPTRTAQPTPTVRATTPPVKTPTATPAPANSAPANAVPR